MGAAGSGPYLAVTALHALWDAAGLAAAWLTLHLTGTPQAVDRGPQGHRGSRDPTPPRRGAQLPLPAADALIGLALVVVLVLRVRRQELGR